MPQIVTSLLKRGDSELFEILFCLSADIKEVLKWRPAIGQLFPYLCTVRAGDRAAEFKQRCDGLEISGVRLRRTRSFRR
jgi:hypothetical protein